MLIKPSHSLQESLFLRKLLILLAHVTSHREAVGDPTEEVDLVWLLCLNEDNLGFVAHLGGEDVVSFRGGEGEGPGDSTEFDFFDEAMSSLAIRWYRGGVHVRRVSSISDINSLSLCQETNGIFDTLHNH